MKNCKLLKEENLLFNLKQFSSKKICAMVKANAYGHGIKEIVKMAEGHVAYFGVVNIDEALQVRKLTEKPILICAEMTEYKTCINRNLEFIVGDEQSLKLAVAKGCKNNIHLKINCGMNRFGISSPLNARIVNCFLEEKQINLKSICTHFPTTERIHKTFQNYENFMKISNEITQSPNLCFGGSGIIKYPFDFDMIRVGIGMYGYGQKKLLPVMEVRSYVSKVFYAKKNNFIGYGQKYKVKSDGFFAIVPVGYGDGLRRNLSGKFRVKINGKKYIAVGNICMDCFFVKVDESVQVGNAVEVMCDAQKLSNICDTIPYEILTGFSNLRCETVIEKSQ